MLRVLAYAFKTDFTKKEFVYGRRALFSAHLWLFILYLLLASSVLVNLQLWNCFISDN